MNQRLLLGPLLSVENDNVYTCCVLTKKEVTALTFKCNGKVTPFSLLEETPSGKFWKVSLHHTDLLMGTRNVYTITHPDGSFEDAHQRSTWSFYLASATEHMQLAYTSCNGFSSAQLMKDTKDPYALWRELNGQQSQKLYGLLIMGGDQLYADSIWSDIDVLRNLIEGTESELLNHVPDEALRHKIDLFYEQLYIQRWNERETSMALATIPNIMMWDDHDIFDGWGSYPEELNQCALYQLIFETARKYFRIFQLRHRSGMLSTSQAHHAYYLNIGNYTVLAMDHRSERTIKQVMGQPQWQDIIRWMKEVELNKNLLVMSGVPVVYRDFSFVERQIDATNKVEETTDDLKDHWRAKEHMGERLRLINLLLSELRLRQARLRSTQPEAQDNWHINSTARTVIMSGDVHIGALGVIMDKRTVPDVKVYQVISSAIVHPPPTAVQWAGIRIVTNDRNEYLTDDKKVETAMVTPVGSDTYIRARNYATLQEGSDGKLWVNWINESDDTAEYPME